MDFKNIEWEDVNPHKITNVIHSITEKGASGCAGQSGMSYMGESVDNEEQFMNIKRGENLKELLDNDDESI